MLAFLGIFSLLYHRNSQDASFYNETRLNLVVLQKYSLGIGMHNRVVVHTVKLHTETIISDL